jgi:hypothetical protein
MSFVTVLFRPSELSQDELGKKLRDMLGTVMDAGAPAQVAPVFPGEKNDLARTSFVVTVPTGGERLATLLGERPEIARAYVTPSRGW